MHVKMHVIYCNIALFSLLSYINSVLSDFRFPFYTELVFVIDINVRQCKIYDKNKHHCSIYVIFLRNLVILVITKLLNKYSSPANGLVGTRFASRYRLQ